MFTDQQAVVVVAARKAAFSRNRQIGRVKPIAISNTDPTERSSGWVGGDKGVYPCAKTPCSFPLVLT